MEKQIICLVRSCLLFFTLGVATQGQTLTCPAEYQFLETQGFQVGEIRFDTPLSFVGKVQSRLEQELKSLRIQKGKPFHCSDYEAALETLSARFGSGSVHPGESFRMAVVVPELNPCTSCETPPTVEVVYHIYTTDVVYYATRVFESDHTALTRALAPPGTLPQSGTVRPLPFIGFNRSRKFVFGSKLSYATGTGLLNSMDMDVSGSGNSATASVSLSGARQFSGNWMSYLRWRVGYQYENIPGESIRLKSSQAALALLGASRALGQFGTIVRFGSALEGGNEQTTLGNSVTPVTAVPILGSPYGSVKSYAGITFNLGRQAFAGSYGIQFGSASRTPSWDYTKHLVNLSYSTRILFAEHKPTAVDLQLSGGYISGSETEIPLPERFFGGNVERNFISGDSWHFPRNPLIRGFSEYQFGRTSAGGGIGGRDFYAANVTVAQAIWDRPVVPEGLSTDPSFRRKLGGQIALARESAKLSYLAEKPVFQTMLSQVDAATPVLGKVRKHSERIRSAASTLPSREDVESILDDLDAAIQSSNEAILTAKTTNATALAQIRFLAAGFPTKDGADDCDQIDQRRSLFTQVRCKSLELQTELHGTAVDVQANELVETGKQLDPLRIKLADQYRALKAQAFLPPAAAEPLTKKLATIDSVLEQMSATTVSIQATAGNNSSQADVLIQDIEEARSGAKSAANAEAITTVGDWFAIGMGKLTPPLLETIVGDATRLEVSTTRSDLTNALHELHSETEQLRTAEADLRTIMETLARPDVEVRAVRDTRFTGRLLDVIFRELNLYTVSPFVMFDLARLGETHASAFQKVRYSAGGGIRLSLVNFNVNIGYGWNANRQPHERAGTFYFSMNISDLFR